MLLDADGGCNVLFLCTGNSARSILAEAILARLGPPRFRAHSAGSRPKKVPHATALETLSDRGYETAGLRSKSWDEFARPDSPRIDLVLTVCDDAAAEGCPIWPGHPIAAHWGVRDPACFEGSPVETRAFFESIYDELAVKIRALIRLDAAAMTRSELRARLVEIGDQA